MAKERIKNLLLVFLVIMNFVLSSKILIEKKLWPEGYNFFSDISTLKSSAVYTEPSVDAFVDTGELNKVFLPDKIIINTGDQTTRMILESNDIGFDNVAFEAMEILKYAFSKNPSDMTEVKKDEVCSAMVYSSLYLEFPTDYDTSFFSGVLSSEGEVFGENKMLFSDIVIVSKPKTEVYIVDKKSKGYYKINVGKSADTLASEVNACLLNNQKSGDNVINYSFDLKFDEPFGSQKTTLNPFIQVYSSQKEYPVIEAANPLYLPDGPDESIIKSVLKLFNINPNTMRRYTEADGTMVFVENNAILKLGIDGYLEYEATDGGMAMSSTDDSYVNASNVAALVMSINKAAGSNGRVQLTESNKKNVIAFESVVSGLAVKTDYSGLQSGVEAVVSDGVLKSYKQLIRRYIITDKTAQITEFISALDSVISDYSEFMKEIHIDKMYFAYTDDGSDGEKAADWIVKVNNVIAEN